MSDEPKPAKASNADWPGPVIKMEEFGRQLAERRAAYEAKYGHSVDESMPRNSGANRTESKKALLKAIDEAAAKKGFRW